MGGGFLIDMLVSMPTMSAEVYFTPMAVLEFCRGMECRVTERTEK